MSDQLGPPIDYFAHYQGGDLHILLDRAGAVEADGAGLKENPPRLMTAAERIKRLGEDLDSYRKECKCLYKRLERTKP